ncbi:MAG: AI-2E family transporter [Elusimicrobia bacterium]|nr:AI-2E family transporter [Elusimicrobiota bacterium]
MQEQNNQSKEKISYFKREQVQKFAPFLLMFGLVLISIYFLRSLIAPILLGCMFTLVLFPVYKKVCSFRISRVLASFLVTSAFAMFILIPITFSIITGTRSALRQISKYQQNNSVGTASIVEKLQIRISKTALNDKVQDILQISDKKLKSAIRSSLTSIEVILERIFETLVKQIPQVVLSGLIVLLTIFFGFIGGGKAIEFIRKITPLPDNKREALFQIIYNSCYSVVFASIVLGIIQALVMALACAITGVKAILFICLLTLIASFVPVIGTAPITIPIIVYFFVVGQIWESVVFAVSAVLIGLVDNIVRPFLLKTRMDLHPFLTLIFVIGAVSVIGFYGLFFGPIIAGILSGSVKLFLDEG